MKPRLLPALGLLAAAAFWLACIVVPVGASLLRAGASTSAQSMWTDPVVLGIVKFTVLQAGLSTLLSVAIGVPFGAWIGARIASRERWARVAQALLAIPFSIPTVVVAAAAVLWLGRSGLLARWGWELDWAYSLKAVILAHVFLNAPWVALQVSHSRAELPERWLEAARGMGAGTGARFRLLVWPFIRDASLTAAVQVFALCAMSFALVLLLGGGPPVETLETAIYAAIRFGSLDIWQASACAAWQLLIAGAPWVALLVMKRSSPESGAAGTPPVARAVRRRWDPYIALPIAALPLIPFVPLVGGVDWIRWFAGDRVDALAEPLRVSVTLALATMLGSLFVACAGILAVRGFPRVGALLKFALMLPSGISMLVLGLGFWLAYSRWIDPFSGSLRAIIALQVAAFFPLAFRTLLPVAERPQSAILDAARTLGASSWRAFWMIEWPRWRVPLSSAAAIVAGASLGELAAVSLFLGEGVAPLPVWLARWSAQYRFEDAQGLAALLLLLAGGLTASVSVLGVVGHENRKG